MTRALGLIRLSKRSDDSTSPARQRADIQARAAELGVDELTIVEDLAVSAFHVHPLKRPKLAAALADAAALDYVIYWRQDRFIRRVYPDYFEMVLWAAQHQVKLVSATEDLGDPTAHREMVVPFLKAWLSQGESESTSERVANLHAYFRRDGRWGGGWAPYGYMPAPNPSGEGKVLVIDAEAAEICREAVRRVIAGEAVNSVVADFNRRGIPSPNNRRRAIAGRALATKDGIDTSAAPWRTSALERILRNPALLGYVVHNKRAVAGDDGTPLVRAPAIITLAEWDQLQHCLGERERTGARRTQTPSLLLSVASCALCGAPLYRGVQTRGERSWAYYRCARTSRRSEQAEPCRALPLRVGRLDELAAALFLDGDDRTGTPGAGDAEIMERVYIPGTDNAEEVALVRRSLTSARAEYDSGGYSYEGGDNEYHERVGRLSSRLRALSEAAPRPARYERQPTGVTFREKWSGSTIQERRRLLLGAGFGLKIAAVLSGAERPPGPPSGFMAVVSTGGVPDVAPPLSVAAMMEQPVDPRKVRRTNVVLSWALDPELAGRAALAAEGRPVAVPDNAAAWDAVLSPVREHLG